MASHSSMPFSQQVAFSQSMTHLPEQSLRGTANLPNLVMAGTFQNISTQFMYQCNRSIPAGPTGWRMTSLAGAPWENWTQQGPPSFVHHNPAPQPALHPTECFYAETVPRNTGSPTHLMDRMQPTTHFLEAGDGACAHGFNISAMAAAQKRALRRLKNKEAAKECRERKKEYVKCLEARVVMLENQNKMLMEELRALRDVYRVKVQ